MVEICRGPCSICATLYFTFFAPSVRGLLWARTGADGKPMKSIACLLFLLLFPVFVFATPPKVSAFEKVAALYADHAAESVVDEPLGICPSLTERPSGYLKRFLSPALLALVLEERRRTKPGWIGNLDFSPLWASQDPAGVRVRVTPGKRDGEVRVGLVYPGRTVELEFKMSVRGSHWLVDDILYPDPPRSLKAILRGSVQRPGG
jgi:hypothetical protein